MAYPVVVSLPDPTPVRFDVNVPDALIGGTYANFLTVWSTAFEFTLDFSVIQPSLTEEAPDGQTVNVVPCEVVARIRVPPGQVFNIMRALSEHLASYERNHGAIARPDDHTPTYPPEA